MGLGTYIRRRSVRSRSRWRAQVVAGHLGMPVASPDDEVAFPVSGLVVVLRRRRVSVNGEHGRNEALRALVRLPLAPAYGTSRVQLSGQGAGQAAL